MGLPPHLFRSEAQERSCWNGLCVPRQRPTRVQVISENCPIPNAFHHKTWGNPTLTNRITCVLRSQPNRLSLRLHVDRNVTRDRSGHPWGPPLDERELVDEDELIAIAHPEKIDFVPAFQRDAGKTELLAHVGNRRATKIDPV